MTDNFGQEVSESLAHGNMGNMGESHACGGLAHHMYRQTRVRVKWMILISISINLWQDGMEVEGGELILGTYRQQTQG